MFSKRQLENFDLIRQEEKAQSTFQKCSNRSKIHEKHDFEDVLPQNPS